MTKLASFLMTFLFAAGIGIGAWAQTPIAVRYTATTDNVGVRDDIRIELFRWSTDEERDQLIAAWQKPSATARPEPAATADPAAGLAAVSAAQDPAVQDPAVPPAAVAGPARGARGAGQARGGAGVPQRGGAAPPRAGAAAPPRAGAGAPARGAANRGARGGDTPAESPVQLSPEASLAAALTKATSVGRMWSSESAGYSFKYAVRLPQPDGGERIVLVSDRRLNPDIWKPAAGTPTNYAFTLIELRLNAKGEGEGKASLTNKVVVDAAAKTFALENYAATAVVLKGAARR